MKNRQWLLARRPDGAIKDSDFNFVETETSGPAAAGGPATLLISPRRRRRQQADRLNICPQ